MRILLAEDDAVLCGVMRKSLEGAGHRVDAVGSLAHTRSLWRRLRKEPKGEVTLRHVRSHIKVPGNELADWLAEQGRVCGARRAREEIARVDRWMRHWLAENMNVNTAGDPTGDG